MMKKPLLPRCLRILRAAVAHASLAPIVGCRFERNSWEDELVRGAKHELLKDERLPFRNCTFNCYLPWEDRRVTVAAPTLPPFRRSIVVRLPSDAVEGVVRAH